MKHIKMLLYGEPGVGKSVFACKAPRPFFITTDGNYEWLEEFGAKEKDHQQVYSWEEAKKLFAQPFDDYDTIVIDLLEDLFKWCEQEYCIRAKIDHVSDVGYGKGYDITRNEFFLEISKLLGKNKNIILLSHGVTFTVKDRRGVEHTKYAPSTRIPDKVLDMIEGRLRYCLRCYLKAEETNDGELIKKRYLSLIPKENEFGIMRGSDEKKLPHDIDLDWNEFARAIGYENEIQIKEESSIKSVSKKEVKEKVKEIKDETKNEIKNEAIEETKNEVIEESTNKNEVEDLNNKVENNSETKEVIDESAKNKNNIDVNEEVKEETHVMTQAEKIKAIKEKLERIKRGEI